MKKETATLSAENMFTTPFTVQNSAVSCWCDGTFTGTLTLQARAAGDSSLAFQDTSISFTAPGSPQGSVKLAGEYEYRFGFKTGDYTNGTAKVVLQSEL